MANKLNATVFLINGFLESGKTTFIKNAILNDPEIEKERVLIICCEQGEEDFSELPGKIYVHEVEEKQDFTSELLIELDKKYRPTYVIIEYNGVWGMQTAYSARIPDGWQIAQQMTIIDATTFKSYFSNMKSIFADMLGSSSTVFVNRCTGDDDFKYYKDSIKICSPNTEIVYISDQEGIMDITLEEDLPYNLDDDVIELDDQSYTTWYIDMLDNIQRYIGKTVDYIGQTVKPDYFRKDYFSVGNMVITCCEDDMQFLGFVCHYDGAESLQEGGYVKVRGQVRVEYAPEYEQQGPVIYLNQVIPVSPPEK